MNLQIIFIFQWSWYKPTYVYSTSNQPLHDEANLSYASLTLVQLHGSRVTIFF